ncbi:hypothetical protein FocTR4_00013589 [Fusarium oxysporum f. sp. cubense]|uniref:ubiquitinyl hydrolase 1 n=1 Tax=Fusarium oxysporum f. sp. cubense TaxID=61366 RepID=A0A5C6SP14_FUSOC|nr:hypothetical protein FocTR4_00013589 [Fusarium oxysporum f. sp. cubense]
MDNVEYLSSADLLLYLQNVCEDQEDIPAHDKELDIATLVGDGTPQEIQYVIDLCKCIDEFEEEEQIKATDRLIAYLLNSPIIDDAEVLEQAIELSATLYRNQSVARDGNLLTHRENNYAKALGHRYWQQGIREDLDESIRLSEEAVAASPQAMFILSSPIGTIQQQPGLEVHALSTLAARLDELFQLTGSLESLNHSINIMERLVTAVHGPDWEDSRTEWLGNLAASIQRRYEQNEGDTSEDIDRAIQISREALQMMNGNDARRSLMLCTLANALGGRAFATDQTDNLDEAVRLLREAHDITPTKDARNIEVCYNLALRLFQRHAASDVKEAISIAESTLEYTHNNHPIRPHLQNLLGALYYQQYTKGVSKEGALKILEISWEALRNSHYPSVLYRLQAGRRILRLCCEMQNWLAAYEAAIATIELIPKLSMREIRNSDRQRLLSKDDVAGFSSDAAAAALNAGKSGFEVIRLLEMGRGSLASSVAELRTDLTSLQREYPNMAEQFIKLRDQLQISSPGQHHVSQGFDALLSVIRQKPGFEDFLMPPGDQKILDAAADGPIIMLNQSEYRSGVDAILIERDNIRIMNLRVSLQDMNMPLGRLQDNDFLERLWGSVAKPILEGLGIGLPSPGAPLPRIWWIPTGALSRLPFHAAGCHFASFADSVIDRAVSSYSSSIKALLETRARSSWLPQQSKDNAVLIGMSNTPGCSTLHYAIKEVQKIANLFATYGFTSTVLSNGRAQKQSILQLLKTCAMFHFAVPSPTAEYGHPDTALISTYLAFYQTDLTKPQVVQCLQRVIRSDDPSMQYERLIHGYKLPAHLEHWNYLTVDDDAQMEDLCVHLRFDTSVGHYFLNNFALQAHAKQFEVKMQASGWDILLVSNNAMSKNLTTGFSGTNDNKTMLPQTIKQEDLPSLLQTNAMRLRQLGSTQSVCFIVPPEVQRNILDLRTGNDQTRSPVTSSDVVYWLLEHSCKANDTMVPLHTSQGFHFCRRTNALWKYFNHPKGAKDKLQLLDAIQQREDWTLEQLYGPNKFFSAEETISQLDFECLKSFATSICQQKLEQSGDYSSATKWSYSERSSLSSSSCVRTRSP